jgi:hypothetical protein
MSDDLIKTFNQPMDVAQMITAVGPLLEEVFKKQGKQPDHQPTDDEKKQILSNFFQKIIDSTDIKDEDKAGIKANLEKLKTPAGGRRSRRKRRSRRTCKKNRGRRRHRG